MQPHLTKRTKLLLSMWLGLWLYAIYLLSFSGKLHVMDELAVFTAGHNLAQYGRADINPLIWTNHWTPNPPGIWGQDHQLYTKKAPGISMFIAPFLWLGHQIPNINLIYLALLTNSVITAMTAALLLIWLTDLGFTRRTAWLTALGYGLCTIAWVYARMFWELSILAFCFLWLAWLIYQMESKSLDLSDKSKDLDSISSTILFFLMGCIAAFSLTLRYESALAVGLIGLYLAWQLWQAHHAPILPRITFWLAYILPVGVTILALAYFNSFRYGSLSQTGYNQEIHFNAPWFGGFGLLFSPGNGLFLFSPFMLLLFGGIRPAWQRLPRLYFALIMSIFLIYWIFYGSWFAWGGIWDWGPRFLLPTLPFLMVLVAATLEQLWPSRSPQSFADRFYSLSHWERVGVRVLLGRFIALSLALLSIVINMLGVAVDFNEHFRRIERGETFRFNWATYPPLGHWYILQEGLTDLMWLQGGLQRAILAPALVIFLMASIGLVVILRYEPATLIALKRHFMAVIGTFIITIYLTYLMLLATAQTDLARPQAQLDLPMLTTLTAQSQPHDALMVAMPPFADAQEITTFLMAYLTKPLPTYSWIESDPRGILPIEREEVWQVVTMSNERVWLFERWLSATDPLGVTAKRLNEQAFPLSEQWFDHSGKLTLYALANQSPQVSQTVNIPFQGGVTLLNFAVIDPHVAAGGVLKVRLTWQAESHLSAAQGEAVVSFVHLIGETTNIAQQDRLLLDFQQVKQSVLLPGQTTTQGYGLQLPPDLAAGSYPVIVGLYLPQSGQRLPRADGSPDDFLYLLNVVVP